MCERVEWVWEAGILCYGVPFVSLTILQKEGTGQAGLGYMYLNGVGVEKVHSELSYQCTHQACTVVTYVCICCPL